MKLLHTLLFLIASVAECLMLSRVIVPQYKLVGEEALLKCDYDLGRDRLYAVKWYKDNEEFFRYVPRFNPPIYTHPVEGVRVESSKSNDKRVFLRSLAVRSTGVYRCEVSAEAPSFASIMGEGRMTVVYLPKEAPQITGVNVREEYEVGDVLDLNCTSAKSFPPAKLTWYINDSPVEVPWSISLHPAPTDPPTTVLLPPPSSSHQHQQQQQHHHQSHNHHHSNQRHSSSSSTSTSASSTTTTTTTSYNSYLMISTLRLQLPLEGHHFGRKGTAKVRCVARISPLFWQDGDERIFGHPGRSISKTKKQQHYNEENPPSSSSSNSNGGGIPYDDEDNNNNNNESLEGFGGVDNNNMEEDNRDKEKLQSRHRHHHNYHQNSNNIHQNNQQLGLEGTSHYNNMGGDYPGEGDDDDEEHYYYAIAGNPAFQREALVLVKGGGCSTMKVIEGKLWWSYFLGWWLLLNFILSQVC